MKSEKVVDSLHSALGRLGFKSTIISADHVPEIQETIDGGRTSGLIDEGVSRLYGHYFADSKSTYVPWARSVICVAVPCPLLEVIFNDDGQRRTTVIPPTYEHTVDDIVAAAIENELKPQGYRISRAALPQKLLAARAGLARYGRNNIVYVEGLGSFCRLLSFYTDLPVSSENWQEPKPLDKCKNCTACIKKCPTGAIDPGRFQVRAELCLTYHNESPDPFPDWINDSWHHCLVGCMKCQHYCPVNMDVRSWTEPFAEFSQIETDLLLRGTPAEELPPDLVSKFKKTSLLEDPAGLARNLKSILASTG